MDLAELHEIAERERQTRKPIRIRCCVAAGCLSANAQAVKQRLEESVAGAGLQERVEVCGVGCLRLCSRGPLVQVDPAGALYENVTPDNAPAIVAALDPSCAPDEASLPARGDPAQPWPVEQRWSCGSWAARIAERRMQRYDSIGVHVASAG
jgi:bidirectional [NiFe] hydrogenase diaphorase subunit